MAEQLNNYHLLEKNEFLGCSQNSSLLLFIDFNYIWYNIEHFHVVYMFQTKKEHNIYFHWDWVHGSHFYTLFLES
jgi:hypothetical protein